VDPGDTASWTYDADIATAALTADDVGTALTTALEEPFPFPQALFDQYANVMLQGDDMCPGASLSLEQILGCTSSSGWWYAGISGYDATDIVDGATPFIQDDLYADMQVDAPDGTRFAIGGSANQHLGTADDGTHTYTGFLQGIFIRTTASSLFNPSVDALIAYTAGEGDGRQWVTLDGAVGYRGAYLMFDDLTIAGDDCPTAASGALRIRDDTEHWYTLDLGDDCDTCGTVYFNGTTDLGEACVTLDTFGGRLASSLLTPWR
jgi:hypothetical protein